MVRVDQSWFECGEQEIEQAALDQNFSFDVFLSYANSDADFARKMVAWLRSCGFKVWIDEEQLVPGSRFRAGLEQGLRESKHLLAILTPAYISRSWTQREIDLFDLTADRSARVILGVVIDSIEIDSIELEKLDQVFQVHQRIKWHGKTLDPDALWFVNCGIRQLRPGVREKWKENGLSLLGDGSKEKFQMEITTPSNPSGSIAPTAGQANGMRASFEGLAHNTRSTKSIASQGLSANEKLISYAYRALHAPNSEALGIFSELRSFIAISATESAARDESNAAWAIGKPEVTAVLSIAGYPNHLQRYTSWSLMDLGCIELASRFLLGSDLLDQDLNSEIWFSWAVCAKEWRLLKAAAARVHDKMTRFHLQSIAKLVDDPSQSFASVESSYNYGAMITPWNNFHLCWIAARLGDDVSAMAYANAVIANCYNGDIRAGRFIARLSTWSIFRKLLHDTTLYANLSEARRVQGLVSLVDVEHFRDRIYFLWNSLSEN